LQPEVLSKVSVKIIYLMSIQSKILN
jgi:hypothetical protein